MEAIASKTSLQVFRIAAMNLRHNALGHIGLAILITMVTPVLFGISNLDAGAAAVPLEMFLALIGIVLLTPMFQPEQNRDIHDLTASKYVSEIVVYMIRTVYSLVILLLIISVFIWFMQVCDCEVSILLLFGTLADALFLGGLGMLGAAIINHTAVAYMLPLIYYTLNYGAGSKLGNFYLFAMTMEQYEPKFWLFFSGLILISAAIITKYLQKRL
ncbi:MAG: hypothetical protein K2N24_07695 [Lachnospiraceae bacterium]|nr:hypothetical protein [Lachnospiraceae bacterium]